MVQRERNNPNNIGHPGTVGNADNGDGTGTKPVGGGEGVAAGRRPPVKRNRRGGGSNTATGGGPSGGSQHIGGSGDDQRLPSDGCRNTQNNQQRPRVAGGVGTNSTAPGNGGFRRGIGGMAVPPSTLMTEQGWIPYYGSPIVQVTTYGGYYVNPAIYTRGTTMINGGVVLPLMHDQRMMDQFYGMINQQNLHADQVNR